MSNPLYNPYAHGNQSSTQGQYGLPSTQTERDPWRASHFGPGSSFSSSGASSAIPDNSGGVASSLMSQSMVYRPEQNRAIMDKDVERSTDMHIRTAREEVRVLGKPMHQSIDQGTRFTSTQRGEFRSSGTGMASYPMSSTSASQGHRHSDVESGSSCLDWSSNYKRPTADDSKYYSSASSNYASGGDSRFNAPKEREHDKQSIPGLGDYDYPVPDKPAAPTESSRPKYTSESASSILKEFGLEKQDLEYLLSYPEDQITPANLPFILRQIRMQKSKRATTADQPKPYLEPQPTRSMTGMDGHSLSSSGGAGMRQKEVSSAVLQPSKVIDYGHTGKYTGGVGDEIGRTSGGRANSGGSMLPMDTYDSSRHNRDPLPKTTTEAKSRTLGSSHEQATSVPSPRFSYSSVLKSVAPPSNDQTKLLPTQPNQDLQTILSYLSLPNKDTDSRVFKSEASKPVPSKEPETDHQSALKTKPTSTVLHGVHPSRPGLVLIGSNDTRGSKDQSKTRVQGSTVAEQMKKQQTQQQMQKKPMQQQSKQQTPKQPVSQMGRPAWPPVFSAAQTVPAAPLIPGINDSSQALRRPAFIPGDPRPIVIPPALPQPVPSLIGFNNMAPATSSKQPPAMVSKRLPTPAMMHDYAAAPPKIFPHTCSLCNKECTHMQDWLSHQNTSLHLQNCNLLRKQYPDWDGEIALKPRVAGRDAKPAAPTSAQTSQNRLQKTSHGSHSRSRSSSPRHRRGPEGRRAKSSSRSRSPHSPRYTRRSRSRSPRYNHLTSSHYRSRSRSPDKQQPPRRRGEKRSSPRKNDGRRSPPRRSDGRRSPPRRSDERRSPPRRSDGRRSPPRRSDERRSPPRRTDGRRSPPRRSDERRSPPRRSGERRFSTEGSSLQGKKSSSAERLAKKLLETSAVQSLSRQSDLETVVKTLAPALLAELVKMNASSSSSSSSKGGKPSSSPRPAVGNKSSFASTAKKKLTTKPSKANPSLEKSEACSSTKIMSGKSSPPTMVRLNGICSSLSHNNVVAAVEQFGKTKSVVLFRSISEAIVCFEKEEPANKLKSVKNFKIKGMAVTIVRERDTVSNEQKKSPQKKPATSSVSTPQTTLSKTVTATRNMIQLKEPLPSGARKSSTGKLTNQKIAAKGSVKGLKTTKMVKGGKLPPKGPVKKPTVKQTLSLESNPMASENQPDTGDSVPKKSETSIKESVVVLKKTAEVDKSANRTVTEPTKGKEFITDAKVLASKPNMASTTQKPQTQAAKLAAAGAVAIEKVEETSAKAVSVCSKSAASKNCPDLENPKPKESETKVQEAVTNVTIFEPKNQANDTEDTEPMQLAVVKLAEPKEVESCADGKGKIATTEAAPEDSAGRPSDSQPPTSTVKTQPTKDNEFVTEAKVLASKAETASTTHKPKAPVDKLAAAGAVAKEKVEEMTAKAVRVPSKSADVENPKPKESETKVQEPVVVPKDRAEIVETASMTTFEPEHQAKLLKPNDTEPMQLGETVVKVAEPREVGDCADGKGKKHTTREVVPEDSAGKPSDSQPPTSTVETQPTQTAVKALPHDQQRTLSGAESIRQKPLSEKSETSMKESVGVLKKTAEVDKSANRTVTEPTKGKAFVTEAKVLASKPNMAPTTQKSQTPAAKLQLKAVSVPSKSAASKNCPDLENRNPKESETKVQEAVTNVTIFEPKNQANDTEGTEPMQLGETVVKVAEPKEVGSCADGKGKMATTEAAPEDSAGKPSDSQPPTSTVKTQPTKGNEFVTEAKVLASKAETASTTQKPKAPVDKLAAARAVAKAKVEGTTAKAVSVPSKSAASENQPDLENPKPKESETKVHGPVVVLKDTAEIVETANVTSFEPKHQAKLDKSNEAEDTEPMQLGETVVKVPEPKEVGSCADGKGKMATTEAAPEDSAGKPSDSQPPTSTVKTQPIKGNEFVTEAKVLASKAETASTTQKPEAPVDKLAAAGAVAKAKVEEAQFDYLQETFSKEQKKHQKKPDTSTPQTTKSTTTTTGKLANQSIVPEGQETKTDAPQMQPQAPGNRTEPAVELPAGGVEIRTMQKDLVTALKTQTDAASIKDESVTTKPTAAVSKQQQAASTSSSTAITTLTIGEMVEKYLDPKSIDCLSRETFFSTTFTFHKQLLITGLPKYQFCRYTEEALAKRLKPFGFQYEDDSIYVVPQARMAFITMPSVEIVRKIIRFSAKSAILFKESKLCLSVLTRHHALTPIEFYKQLMMWTKAPVSSAGLRTVFVKNISPSETRNLREALKKIGCVRNFLPLLNKVFIEFEFDRDADRLGVWFSLLKQAPRYEVHRLSVQHGCIPLPPKLPEAALPDSKDAVAGATVPPVQFGVPHGSIAPFWVTIKTSPFLFPTMSPWFIIPDHLTVRGKDDIEEARLKSSRPTVMLTGLPVGKYTHVDVAKLVWRYFPKKNLDSLYYNVIVLTLQRRAFVHFDNWTTSCDFVQANVKKNFKDCKLGVHFVLQDMNPESSEEMMYKNLMKWSNAGVPEPKSLEERLLCVEISETSVDIVRMVMEVVLSISTFVGFLPLANRICIEMADSSGVTKVVEKYKTFSPESLQKRELWSKVQRFETLKSLKQRLDDASEITINFEGDTINVVPKPPAVKCQTQPPSTEPSDNGSQSALQASGPCGSNMSEPITDKSSSTATSDVEMEEDGEKPATEIAVNSTVGPEANKDVEKAEVKEEEGSLVVSISLADVTSAVASGPGGSTNSEPVTEGSSATTTSDVAKEEDGKKSATETAINATVGPETNEDVEKEEVKEEEGSLIVSISLADVTLNSAVGTGPGGSTNSEPITEGPSATTTNNVAMEEDGKKPATEIAVHSTVGPEANEDVEKVEVKEEEGSLITSIAPADVTLTSAAASGNTVPAASSSVPSATAAMPEENIVELPQISTDIFKVLMAAVHQRRFARESKSESQEGSQSQERSQSQEGSQRHERSKSQEKECPSKNNTSSVTLMAEDRPRRYRNRPRRYKNRPRRYKMVQDDFTDDTFSSHAYLFDDPTFNMEDFVTVDEVGDDVEDTSLEPHSSSSSSSRARGKRQKSSGNRQTPKRYSKYSKGSASFSSSTKLNRGSSSSNSNFVSRKKSTDLSEPTKSPTKPSSFASVSKPFSSSSTLSIKIPSSPGQKAQQSKTKSPFKPSNSPSSSCSTRSSYAAHERETITSAVTVEVSKETNPEPFRKEAKATEGAVAMFDHKVSAQGTAAKTETKIETSSELHPPPQGEGFELSQAQSLEIDVNVNTLEDQKTSKEEDDDVDKHTQEEDSENYQILDSLDQMDEQINDLDSVNDKGKACPEELVGSFEDSVTKEQAATSQEDSFLVQDGSSTVKQLSEEDAVPVVDKSDDAVIDQETNKDNFQVFDTCRKRASMGNNDGKTKEKEEKDKGEMLSAESCSDHDDQIPNEEQTLQDRDDGCTEQETFEILDSIDDQTETEEGIPKLRSIEEEECTYQVIDSLEDQPMTTESETDNMERRAMKRGATTRKDDGLSKRSGPKTTSKSEISPKKQDRTVKKYETQTKRDTTAGFSKKDKDTTEEMVYKIVDSVNDEPVQDSATTETSGRRSARGNKEDRITLNLKEASEKPVRDEEDTYEILDSVEDETADNEPTVRSTRGKRERTVYKDASKEKTPTRRRHTPARESQELNKEPTPKKEKKAPPKESSPTKKSDIVREVSEEDATYEILDSVQDEVVKVDRPAGRHKGKRGRPKKAVRTTKKDNLTLKKVASEKMAEEEEETYQILDSVEDSGSLAGSAKNEEEEEPVYQIVDSLEDDQEELTATGVSDKGRKGNTNETPTCDRTTVEMSEKVIVKKKMVDGFQEVQDDPSAGGSATRIDDPNLDQVSEEEEDYPDDTAEEEELRKRQDATRERQLAKEREVKRTREKEERRTREQRSRSSSSKGGGNKGRTRRGNEEVEVDTKELVTLDEVGADEAGEERAWEITEGELQTLVTLDEFVEEEEDGKAEQSTPETRPLHQEDESEDSLNPETLVTLDEAGDDEEEQPHEEQAEKTSRSAKRKHDDDTAETMNFVTVDEVGEVEEEEEKEVTTRTRSQARKRTRQTPVRKFTRGKKVSATDEREVDVLPPTSLDASSSLDKDPSTLSSCDQPKVQKTETEEEAASQADSDAASAENQTLEGGVEEGEEEKQRRKDINVVSKERGELVGPEAKRSRSQSPSVAADLKLPTFKPNNPLGEEFMVPLSGFFCNLCSVFYESTAKDLHCSSQMHYDNLQRHYQKLEQKPSTSST